MKRSRGRGRRSGGGNNNPNKHFESTGPDVKIRGSAQQILDKYQQYARDAQSSGDRVNAENYLQHAEHYYRVLAAMKPPEKPKQEPREGDAKDGETPNPEAKADGEEENKRENNRGRGRTRNRRDRDERKEAKGADEETGETRAKVDTDATDTAEADTSDVSEAKPVEEKPKRRRSTKKREAEPAEATDARGEGDDGVMKTLSRGRKKAEPKAEIVETAEATATED